MAVMNDYKKRNYNEIIKFAENIATVREIIEIIGEDAPISIIDSGSIVIHGWCQGVNKSRIKSRLKIRNRFVKYDADGCERFDYKGVKIAFYTR